MNIHEYQTKELLREYGVPVPDGRVAHNDADAASVAEELGGERWVVKAQIHAGGRGKAGGVKVANSVSEVKKHADDMIGMTLVTHQTGPEGRNVQRVLVEKASDVESEFYLGFVIDRASQRITIIASASGGMDIEEVAKTSPEKVIREQVDPAVGLRDFQCRKIAARIGLDDKSLLAQAVKMMKSLYRAFRDNDALMAEINPMALVDGGTLMALDAKMNFDANAMYRRANIVELRDFDEEDSKEVEATGHGLNYIALDGSVGCIVNGAGLAMATMDAIVFHNGRPANFLDVGGGASPEKIANAFRIVLQDGNVKVPVVVRLAGTNVDEGNQILADSGLELIRADNLNDAAEKVVATLGDAA